MRHLNHFALKKLSIKSIRLLPGLFIFLWMFSCIEPFDTAFRLTDSILVVDGNLTDQEAGNYVSLRNSKPSSISSSSSIFEPIKDASVWVLIDDSEKVNLSHFDAGTYSFPEGFKAENGRSYQLFFDLSNGNSYQSDAQVLKTVSPIKKVYQEFVSDGIRVRDITAAGHKIYLDMDEPEGKGDAYYWTWKSYEKQNYCTECYGGRYYRNPGEAEGVCVSDQLLIRYNVTYDYKCEKPCWEIIYSNTLNAMNDAFIDGRSLVGKQVAEVPLYTRNGAVIEIKQHAINDKAYKYLKLLIDQNQNSGGLADTPSTALIGNMTSSTNRTESVGGYFVVSSVHTVHYFLDRADVINGVKAVGFQVRESNPEPSGADTTRPPLAPCNESVSRTSVQPINWID